MHVNQLKPILSRGRKKPLHKMRRVSAEVKVSPIHTSPLEAPMGPRRLQSQLQFTVYIYSWATMDLPFSQERGVVFQQETLWKHSEQNPLIVSLHHFPQMPV